LLFLVALSCLFGIAAQRRLERDRLRE